MTNSTDLSFTSRTTTPRPIILCRSARCGSTEWLTLTRLELILYRDYLIQFLLPDQHAEFRGRIYDSIIDTVGATPIVDAEVLLDGTRAKNVVLDFRRTDYYGSTALSFFVKIWKRVREVGGQMVFCNLSEHEREILAMTSLDALWPICHSRESALEEARR